MTLTIKGVFDRIRQERERVENLERMKARVSHNAMLVNGIEKNIEQSARVIQAYNHIIENGRVVIDGKFLDKIKN